MTGELLLCFDLLLSQNLIKMDIWGSLKGKELPLRDAEVRVVRRTLGGSITSSPTLLLLCAHSQQSQMAENQVIMLLASLQKPDSPPLN